MMACQTQPVTIYVSPTGDDTNDGSQTAPYKTIQKAIDATSAFAGKQPVSVQLHGGIYYLEEPLKVLPEHSGSEQYPITYTAASGAEVIINGGIPLQPQWQPYQEGILMTKVPIEFDQFFVNGKRQLMARYPNYDPNGRYFNGYAPDADSPKKAAGWANPEGGFLHAIHSARWGGYHYLIKGKKENDSLIFDGGWQNNRQMGYHPKFKFIENIFEELDAPGEWFLDKKSMTLYYYPNEGEDINNAEILVSKLPHLLEVRGSEQNPVHHIQFKNITFKGTKRTFMQTKEQLLRSDWAIYRGGMILVQGGEHLIFDHLTMDSPGGNGFFADGYNRDITISNSHIFNAGASGICFVGRPEAVRSPLFEYHETQTFEGMDHTPGPKTNDYPANCTAYGNLINHIGQVEKQAAGIQIAMATEIMASHNTIYETSRAGINIGDGTWGGHIIEYNDVFNTVTETSDHGSINSWGRDRFWQSDYAVTTKWVDENPDMPFWDAQKLSHVRNNRFRCDNGWDIDLDDGSTNYDVYNNLCLSGGIKVREGYRRHVYNNIMVNNSFRANVFLPTTKKIVLNAIL